MKKRIVKRILCGMLVTAMGLAALAGCGNAEPESTGVEKEPIDSEPGQFTEAENAEEGNMVGMANPWVDITEAEANEIVMRLFKMPEGAESLGWMKCEELGDPDKYLSPLVQLSFSMDDLIFTARAQQGAAEDADIAGLYVEWTDGPNDVTLANWGEGHMQGKTYRSINDTGYVDLITWYDIEIGILYSLSCAAEDLDGFDIQAVAEQMYSADNEPYNGIPDAPEVKETSDGVYGAHMQFSDRDKIGTQNDVGVFYDIVYQSMLNENDLYIVGSMSYKNSKDQDAMFISDDQAHIFTIDGNTEFEMRGGESGAEKVTVQEFTDYLTELMDTGLYLEIEVENGTVKVASISA